ncbi:RIP metalloprotease RseP [Ignatzschineria ureiclastica]|uniref:Zinc metalloprotease n=1 Tax=Ignatzschineria ureiclastica TaxID=472582 RepID=A0A2U2AGS0_9GAMM|nr:RIP metalloprotease RseP [Ignatzschineria ureiclastica]PWD81852.1 RIP metalloprotease RseP [Ignatzschineria ureiclastica]GGZ90940.1 zinc metalloprotease [Ignatzschineria ureiclastica]
MMTFFNSIFGFLILMGVLVTLHEFGHFYVAKKLGFKVLTFSIGFGKKLWSRTGKDGVEYRIGLIPLGGYVAMLDERAHEVKPEEQSLTFNAQPLWKRALVVAAGPGVNLLFAVILLFGLYLYGLPALKAKIDTPPPESTLAIAGFERGDEIVAIEGQSVKTFEEMMMGFVEHLNDGKATVDVIRDGQLRSLQIDMAEPLYLRAGEYVDTQLGVKPYLPIIPSVVGLVVEGGAASKAGIQKGDQIVAIEATPIESWQQLLGYMHQLGQNQSDNEILLNVAVLRDQQILPLTIPLTRDEAGFRLGVGTGELSPETLAEFETIRTLQQYSPLDALGYALQDTYRNSLLIFKFIKRMFTGEVHINTMAGPVTIAEVAGDRLSAGWIYFIQLMAIFSVNLGILNLLPLPVLDGGRLVGFGIEAVVGRDRIPKKLSLWVMQIGALCLFLFMAFIVLYDITKWF